MPGHTTDTHQVTIDAIKQLDTLISEHDAVFLLTDSRESRWLPNVLGTARKQVYVK